MRNNDCYYKGYVLTIHSVLWNYQIVPGVYATAPRHPTGIITTMLGMNEVSTGGLQ